MNVIQMLQEKRLKVTSQRVQILRSLIENKIHPTVEDIFNQTKDFLPGLSLNTVYKNLETLIDHNLAKKVFNDDGHLRYDACLEEHCHILDTKTGEMKDWHEPELIQVIKEYFNKKNIENIELKDVQVLFKI